MRTKTIVGLLCLSAAALPGAEWRVCNGVGCHYPVTAAGANAAVAGASCGDVVKIEGGSVINVANQNDVLSINKHCPPGQELLITSNRDDDWLPASNERVTPGYLAHLPLFDMTQFTANLPVFRMDFAGVSGVILRNLAIRVRAPAGFESYSVVKVGPPQPTSPASLASNITLDRVYITGGFDPARRVANPVQVNGSVNVLNSFFDDIHKRPFEEGYHIYVSNDSVGPFNIVNNYFGGGVSVGVLTGGGGGVYFTDGQPHPQGYVVEHNHFYNSPKFYERSSTYVGDENRPCIKNFFEMKTGSTLRFRWNGTENSFNGCGSQWNGLVMTVRNIGWMQGGRAALSDDRKTVTITNYSSGSGLLPPIVGNLIGVAKVPSPVPGYPSPGQFEWRTITQVTGDRNYEVDSPFPANLPALTNAEWALVAIPWGRIHDIYAYGNFFRNTATSLLTLGHDDFHEGGGLSGLVFKNNLTVNDSPLMVLTGAQFFQQVLAKVVNGGENITIENNTFLVKDTVPAETRVPTAVFHMEQNEPERMNVTKALRIRNNVAAWGQYGVFSSGVSINNAWNQRTDEQLEFRNNVLLGTSPGIDWRALIEGCNAPRICKENYIVNGAQDVDFSGVVTDLGKNEFSLRRAAPTNYEGFDGSTPGVDVEEVPMIRGLTIVPGVRHLNFQWRVSNVLRYASCSMEVSGQKTLIDDTGTFVAVNALRPDYFKRANYDLHNPRAAILSEGLERTFQVGEDSTVTDDNGTARDLRLEPDTDYYYRVMCGGVTERGTVRTLSALAPSLQASSPQFSVTVYVKPVLGSRVRIRYGGLVTPGPANTASTSCTGQCQVQVPWSLGRALVVYVDELNEADEIVLGAIRPIVVASP
jgi:hypothetical protein